MAVRPNVRTIVSGLAVTGDPEEGEFLGIAPTGRTIQFETVDAMRVTNGKITEHWGVANLFSLMQQLGATFSIPATRS